MDLMPIIQGLMAKFPALSMILVVLGSLVVLAQVLIPLTPSKADDAAWAKINSIPVIGSLIKILLSFAPIKKA